MNNETPSQAFKKEMHKLIQEVMDEAGIYKCCLNCCKFNEDTELCKLCTPPARPPARVITFGCPAFVELDAVVEVASPLPPKPLSLDFDDDIPF